MIFINKVVDFFSWELQLFLHIIKRYNVCAVCSVSYTLVIAAGCSFRITVYIHDCLFLISFISHNLHTELAGERTEMKE
nr:hypothetical protein CFP56_45843 [Quercus suber]